MNDMKPCPWCGHDDLVESNNYPWNQIECINCGAMGPISRHCSDSREKWNQSILMQENAKLRSALVRVEWFQSPTGLFCPWCDRAYTWGEIGPYKHKPDCQRQAALGLSPEGA